MFVVDRIVYEPQEDDRYKQIQKELLFELICVWRGALPFANSSLNVPAAFS
jgi:hypothetical protein